MEVIIKMELGVIESCNVDWNELVQIRVQPRDFLLAILCLLVLILRLWGI
jgi:hypothetical protein